jgi:amidase
MATWITRLDEPGDGPTVAVKDAIDVAGVVTTVGSPAVADAAAPAAADAACVRAARAAGARLVGKTNLHELAFGGTGVNPWYGTPVNPVDPALVPGGSSSGNAVALASGEVYVAIGTDTAGSVRTPSACCGTVGLKTTHGRLPLAGVWPLAPSLDTVGPMARDTAGIVTGMALLEPGFSPAAAAAPLAGRVRLPGTDPVVDRAIDALLAEAEIETVEVELAGWTRADRAARVVLFAEAWSSDGHLYEAAPHRLGADVRERLAEGRSISRRAYDDALAARAWWRAELAGAFERAPVLVLPTLRMPAPRLDARTAPDTRYANAAVNLAGHPALAIPAPSGSHAPVGMQLLGPDLAEELLVTTAALFEAAARTLGGSGSR